jgi:hypothetical protein
MRVNSKREKSEIQRPLVSSSWSHGLMDSVHKVKVLDKTKALEMLAKHFALLVERVELQGEVAFRWLNPDEKL